MRILILTVLFSIAANAGEPLFGYVYTTDTVPKGHFELEQWLTDREGQAGGTFHHLDMKTEVEYGVSDNFQVSMYVNYMYADESANSVRGLTEGIEIPWDHDPRTPYRTGRFEGFSFEFQYRLLSPYLDPIGLSFYLEPELGYAGRGIEFRTIVQKNFLDDLLVLALNGWIEFEQEAGSNLVAPGSSVVPDGAMGNATMAEIDLGASYRFISNWSVGLEFRNHNEYQGTSLRGADQDHTAFFFGPNIHYASQNWFFTLSLIKQIGAVGFSDDQKASMANGLLYGDEHTSWDGIRLKVGFPL